MPTAMWDLYEKLQLNIEQDRDDVEAHVQGLPVQIDRRGIYSPIGMWGSEPDNRNGKEFRFFSSDRG